MNSNPLNDGALTENSADIGSVTPKMVLERAAELAIIDGLAPVQVPAPIRQGMIDL
jgi:hypothetical protein